MLLVEDGTISDARAAFAFPLFARFQPDWDADRGVDIIGLRNLCMKLTMDISEVDLDRVFAAADPDKDGFVTSADFREAVRAIPFFENLAKAMTASLGFRVGREYDYSRSTRDNYADPPTDADPSTDACHTDGGDEDEVLAARKVLQLGQEEYSRARVEWQHAVVRRAVLGTKAQTTPWAVFTLSARGALPREVLEWMARQGLLQLSGVLHISAAHFMHCMPEFPLYVRRHGPASGTSLLQQEAEFLEGLALELALVRQQHVWVQCLPDDAARLCTLLKGLRRRHPGYRTAVLDVRADVAALRRRHRAVLRETGRGLPESPVEAGEAELAALAAQCDLLAQIENSDERQPVLRSLRTVDASGRWEGLRRSFGGGRGRFTRGPLRFKRRSVAKELLSGPAVAPDSQPGNLSLDLTRFGAAQGFFETSQRLAALVGDAAGSGRLELALSQAHGAPPGGSAGLVPLTKDHLGAPASSCAWMHGLAARDAHGSRMLTARLLRSHGVDPDNWVARLLALGAFVHFDKKGGAACVDVPTDEPSDMILQFGQPEELPSRAVASLRERWHPVVDEALWGMGARCECWLPPGEKISGDVVFEGGAFAYQLSEEAAADMGYACLCCRVLV